MIFFNVRAIFRVEAVLSGSIKFWERIHIDKHDNKLERSKKIKNLLTTHVLLIYGCTVV